MFILSEHGENILSVAILIFITVLMIFGSK